MSMFADPHPAMLFFSLPLGSTCPPLVQMPYPCSTSPLDVRSTIPKLMNTPHHQGCFTVPDACSGSWRRDSCGDILLKSP
jgi:hypothetical protein